MNFHEKLSELKGGMSTAAFARKLGEERYLVEDWLKSTMPSLNQAMSIARHLGVPIEYLADDEMETVPGPPKLSENRRKIEELIAILGEDESLSRLKGAPLATTTGNPPIPPEIFVGKPHRGKHKYPDRE